MFSLVFAALVAWSSGAGPIGYDDITCGSTVKMIHVGTKMSLKSQNVQFGTGSGQQTVTLADQRSSADDYWQIRAAHGKECKQGYVVVINYLQSDCFHLTFNIAHASSAEQLSAYRTLQHTSSCIATPSALLSARTRKSAPLLTSRARAILVAAPVLCVSR